MSDTIAKLVVSARESAGWTRRELARRSGVAPATLASIETGRTIPSPRISAALEGVGVPARRPSAVEASRQQRADEAEGGPSALVSADALAEVASPEDTTASLMGKLCLGGTRGRRVVERRLAKMRRDLGWDPKPGRSAYEGRRAGEVACAWRRRFGGEKTGACSEGVPGRVPGTRLGTRRGAL